MKIRTALLILALASTGCEREQVVNIEPPSSGAFLRVRAFETTHDAALAQLRPGASVRLGMFGYTATDSINADANWVVRDTHIASNVGSTVTAIATGSTYVIGSVANHGALFSDSVLVSASP